MAIFNTQIQNIIVCKIRKQFYEISRQSISRLVIPAKVFCLGLLLRKHLCHSISRHFASVIFKDYTKSYQLTYKVYQGKLETKPNGQK